MTDVICPSCGRTLAPEHRCRKLLIGNFVEAAVRERIRRVIERCRQELHDYICDDACFCKECRALREADKRIAALLDEPEPWSTGRIFPPWRRD